MNKKKTKKPADTKKAKKMYPKNEYIVGDVINLKTRVELLLLDN